MKHFWFLIALAWCLAGCREQPAMTSTSIPSPSSLAGTEATLPSRTPQPGPDPTASPLPSATSTATPIPVTLYNRYLGRDTTRQPELVKTPLGQIVPVSQAEGYAHSYIEIFLGGKQVNGEDIRGDASMLAALIRLFDDAYKAQHTSQTVLSSYRSYAEQAFLGDQDPEENGNFLAEPGRSEHHLGTAVDLAWQTDRLNFYIMNLDPRGRAFYNWLKENAQRYGFVFSYPYKSTPDQSKNNLLEPFVTEYKAEPWHLRFVGPQLAQQIYAVQDAAGRNYLDPLSEIIPQQFFVP